MLASAAADLVLELNDVVHVFAFSLSGRFFAFVLCVSCHAAADAEPRKNPDAIASESQAVITTEMLSDWRNAVPRPNWFEF